jgi:hypothetical protein
VLTVRRDIDVSGQQDPCPPPFATVAAQRAALVDLYIATNGDSWTSGRTGWQDHATGSDPCDDAWIGVTCAAGTGAELRNRVMCVRQRRPAAGRH